MLYKMGLAVLFSAALAAGDGGWEQTYSPGYVDSAGHYAGGSEVMWLQGHKGKMYAAVGYWEDDRYNNQTVGATVIRLDSPTSKWEVDLATTPQHMKLNLLKSITFTKAGKTPLAEPVNLLVAAVGDLPHYKIDFYTRDDSKNGTWVDDLLIQGKSGEGRFVPRALVIHTDSVTGEERIFCALGNPGVLSGVYDPTIPSKIRWDSEREIKNLTTRPLGMAVVNGELWFSEGAQLYRRNDGSTPTYTVAVTMTNSTVNPDLGGIRGLTVIDTPGGGVGGRNQSALFMWIPKGGARGCMTRLDPDPKDPDGYVQVQEGCVADLMEDALKTKVIGTLGNYNNAYPVVDGSGKPVHIIGYEGTIANTSEQWNKTRYYGGGMYAIRDDASLSYRWQEINGRWSRASAKTVLIAPRTFCLSAFPEDQKEQVLYAAGFDTNFNPATNHAWVFRAPLSAALSIPQP